MDKTAIFEGYLIFTLINKGSKSERFAPLLLSEEGQTLVLYVDGDNPIACESLQPFHKTYCSISGEPNPDSKLLKVKSIKTLPDPWYMSISNIDEDTGNYPVK